MRKYVICLLVGILSFVVVHAQADSTKKAHVGSDVKITKNAGERGKDKIQNDLPTTRVIAPLPDSGSAAYDCITTFDNFTGYWIRVYINGNYMGDIEPWGKGEVKTNKGDIWYCEPPGGVGYFEGVCNCEADQWINLRL